MSDSPVQLAVEGLTMAYNGRVIQRDLDFAIRRGSRFVIMGGSGCGKSTLMKHMIGLLQPAAGRIVFGDRDLWSLSEDERTELSQRFGVLYQSGALWSSMTLAENVALPLQQHTALSAREVGELVELKLALVGLERSGELYPSELSGGMRKRGGLARAMALDPEILFLDEPSAGLDPPTSRRLDELILELNESLGVTFVVVTHELESIYAVGNDAVFLDAETKTMIDSGPPMQLAKASASAKVRDFLARSGVEVVA